MIMKNIVFGVIVIGGYGRLWVNMFSHKMLGVIGVIMCYKVIGLGSKCIRELVCSISKCVRV